MGKSNRCNLHEFPRCICGPAACATGGAVFIATVGYLRTHEGTKSYYTMLSTILHDFVPPAAAAAVPYSPRPRKFKGLEGNHTALTVNSHIVFTAHMHACIEF